MVLVWAPTLSTGLEWQDSQHKELISRINEFIAAMKHNKGEEELRLLFGFLDNYVKRHFHDEEVAMQKHGYPEIETHRRQHRQFIDNIRNLRTGLRQGETRALANDIRKAVGEWFFEHIAKSDKRLGEFLVAQGAPSRKIA